MSTIALLRGDLVVSDRPIETTVRWPWIFAILLGASFFAFQHDTQVSTYKLFIPDKDAIGSEGGVVKSGRSLGMLAIGVLGGLSFLLSPRTAVNTYKPLLLPIALLMLWTMMSFLWTASLAFMLKNIFMTGMCLLGAAGCARRYSLTEIIWMLMITSLGFIIVGLGVELALGTFRPFDREHRFAGTMHPNSQSLNCAILCLGGFSIWRTKKRFATLALLLMVIGAVAMVATRCRGGLVALTIGMGANWFWTSSQFTKIMTFVWGCCAAALLALMLSLQGYDVMSRFDSAKSMGRADGEDTESFSGRFPLWTALLTQSKTRFPLGFGYNTFWNLDRVKTVWAEAGWDAPDAHSIYIESLLNWGLPGIPLIVWIILGTIRRASVLCEQTHDAGAAFFASFFLYVMVNGVSESILLGASFGMFVAAVGYFQMTFWTPASAEEAK